VKEAKLDFEYCEIKNPNRVVEDLLPGFLPHSLASWSPTSRVCDPNPFFIFPTTTNLTLAIQTQHPFFRITK
jgi:hypothetical protein